MHEHIFIPSDKKDYEICTICGSYHSTAQVEPKVIYEDNEYWGDGTGRSTLEQQISNFNCTDDCGISKADRIMQFIPKGRRALEIACVPAVILNRLAEIGYETWGIEPSEKYIDFICKQAQTSRIIHGYFPDVFDKEVGGSFDCIVAIDVMEHTDDYKGFFDAVHRLLIQEGTAVIMSPIILEDGLYRQRDFDHADEHAWIHTQKGLEPYLKSMFSEVEFKRWIVGHELIKLVK